MGYVINNIVAKAEGVRQQGGTVFSPLILGTVMEEFQVLLTLLENRGWVLTHWAATSHGGMEKGYPVFRYQGD